MKKNEKDENLELDLEFATTEDVSETAWQNEYVDKAKRGDVAAFEHLIKSQERIVYNIAYRMINNKDDAYDLSQEIFIKIFRNLRHFNGQSSFSTWVYRIAVNACIDEIRKRKNKGIVSIDQELEGDDGHYKKEFVSNSATPEEAMIKKEEQLEITRAINALSEEHRAVIILREIHGMSYEEIAGIVGMSLGTVKSRISRARSQFKQEILKIWERNKK
ncbi:MAG: sigma-70 family RNA polymerase sigma factor [Bacillota bacterium]